MRCLCPHCCRVEQQTRNIEGLNYCTSCHKLFLVPPPPRIPAWILGVLVVLNGHWQLLCR